MSPVDELAPYRIASRRHGMVQWIWRILIVFLVLIECISIWKQFSFADAMAGGQLLVIDTNKTLSTKIDRLDQDLVTFSQKVDSWNGLFTTYTDEGIDRQKKNEQLIIEAKKITDDMMRRLSEFSQSLQPGIQAAIDASKAAETAAHASKAAAEETRAHSAITQKRVLQRLPPPQKKKNIFGF